MPALGRPDSAELAAIRGAALEALEGFTTLSLLPWAMKMAR
jgi:hypothetical protein